MANNDRVQAAADQLYAADPAEFTDRRSDLVAQARADGDQAAARAIGALRGPTRAAWVVNQLARADPDAVARLGRLGDELRAAESALDGGKLRELSQTRRELLGQLARQALDGAGVTDPPDALQQEVTGTLSAALADPQVAATVGQGQLAKSVQPSGFGFGLAAGDDDGHEDAEPSPPPAARDRAGRPNRARPQGRNKLSGNNGNRLNGSAQHRAIDEAAQTLAEADRVADSAQSAEADRENTVRQLEEQLEDAQDALADAKRRSREARTAQRQARKALERLRDRAGL